MLYKKYPSKLAILRVCISGHWCYEVSANISMLTRVAIFGMEK